MKHASFIGTRPGIMGLGNALIRLRLRGNASHCEMVFEPGDGVDHLMPDGTCEPDSQGRLWCASSVGLEKLPQYSRRRAGKLGGVRFKRIDVSGPEWELTPTNTQPLYAANTAAFYEGARYDWGYILAFLLGFCHSEIVEWLAQKLVQSSWAFQNPTVLTHAAFVLL
jgi:hypothetical protein